MRLLVAAAFFLQKKAAAFAIPTAQDDQSTLLFCINLIFISVIDSAYIIIYNKRIMEPPYAFVKQGKIYE